MEKRILSIDEYVTFEIINELYESFLSDSYSENFNAIYESMLLEDGDPKKAKLRAKYKIAEEKIKKAKIKLRAIKKAGNSDKIKEAKEKISEMIAAKRKIGQALGYKKDMDSKSEDSKSEDSKPNKEESIKAEIDKMQAEYDKIDKEEDKLDEELDKIRKKIEDLDMKKRKGGISGGDYKAQNKKLEKEYDEIEAKQQELPDKIEVWKKIAALKKELSDTE